MSASLKREIAAVFKQAAVDTGDEAWLRAAAALEPKRGRRPIDDSAALDQASWLLRSGQAASAEEAASIVAATLPGEQSLSAARERLADKLRVRNKISKEIDPN
jgi:hypothetical protein